MVCLKKYFGDSLLFSSFQYYTIVFLYVLSFYFIKYHQNPYFTIWVIYACIPLLDELLSLDLRNPTKEEAKRMENDLRFKLPLYITLFFDWFFTFFLLNFIASQDLSVYQIIGCIILGGNFSGININISHELMHKNNRLDQTLGMLTLSKNLYMHFYIEHVHGHHKNVATPNDPATSKFNQTVYEFLPQTLIGSIRDAWKIECKRLTEIKKYKSVWTLENKMLLFSLNNILLPVFIYKFFGFLGVMTFLGTAFIGILLLEVINYIEHYGLRRKEISPGVYEKVNIYHSWNTPHRLSNYLLFKLQRHSDHHENGYKPYQILNSFDESPHLPHGYTVCLLIALNPKLWFKIMNEYVINYNNGKKISEEIRKKINWEIVKFIGKFFVISTPIMLYGFI